MSRPIDDIERDIQESRARLDQTINLIQDRLSVSGVVEEVMGAVRSSEYGPVVDEALDIVKRHPGPVLLVAAGLGWLFYRMSQEQQLRIGRPVQDVTIAEEIPVLNTGHARVYDPDHSPRHPAQDSLETRREAAARA